MYLLNVTMFIIIVNNSYVTIIKNTINTTIIK